MFSDIDWDFWGPVLNVFAVICVFVCCLIFVANWTNKKSCYAGYAEYNPEYSFWGGCRIMHDGRMTPTEIIRGLE